MLRTQRLFTDREGAPRERFGLGIAALGNVQQSEVVQGLPNVGMLRSQQRFTDREGALVERFGLDVFPLAVEPHRLGVEPFGNEHRVGAGRNRRRENESKAEPNPRHPKSTNHPHHFATGRSNAGENGAVGS
jgi:hypothetical protein